MSLDLDEHGVLDALELRRRGGEVGWVGHLEEEERGELTDLGHDRVECGELARDPIRVVDAFGAQRLLEGGADRVSRFSNTSASVSPR